MKEAEVIEFKDYGVRYLDDPEEPRPIERTGGEPAPQVTERSGAWLLYFAELLERINDREGVV